MANQVDFKILPSDQFSVYSPSTRSDKIITYFTLLSKLRGDILAVGGEDDPNDIVSAYYSNTGGTQTLHLVKADGSEVTASQSQQVISGTLNYVSKFTSSNDIGDSQIFDDGTNVGIGTTTMNHKLELGTGGVFADYFQLDTTYSNGFVVGAISWDQDNGTADVGLSGSLKLKIGQDDVWYVKNQTGSTITKGTAVYANGTLGASSRITVAPMIADGTIPARFFLGIVAEDIINGADGYVLARGKIRQISTLAYNEGDVLWVSPTTAGALTATEPTAPNLKLPVAFVVYKASNGVLAVRATTGTKIADASDVDYTGAADNSFLVYDLASGVWVDEAVGIFKTIAVDGQSDVVADAYDDTLTLVAGTNVTITTNASTDTITINSTDEFVGTVTSVATTAPITGGTITTTGTIGITQSGAASDGYLSSVDWNTFNSKEPALTKGDLTEATSSVLTITGGTGAVIGTGTTIQVAQAGASSSGYLSSTDWNTFNNKQNAITLTTTGTSGVATLVGATLNIPDYTEQYSGTVTSVATTAPITGGTITTTGTIGITQAGAATDGYLSSADWTTFNSKEPALTKGNLTEVTSAVLTITGGTNAVIGSGTTIQVAQSGAASDGYLSSTDWTSFNSKQDALTFTAPLVDTSGTITITQSGAATDGYLSSTDWNTFNGKASNSFTTISVATQSDIVADSATDTLTIAAGTGVSITTDATTDTLTISATGSGGTVTSVDLTAGTGISVSGGPITTSGSITVTNTAPDQTVVLTDGTGITTSGTYPNFTITNSAPDQTVALTAGTGISVTGTYPNFTITNSSPSSGGTVTSISTTAPITGGTITSTGTIGITQSGAAADGYLSSTDWNTFNGKQNAITLTTTGTSGAATLIGATLNIPDYTEQYTGTVTSVDLTAGTGISVSGGPITTSGSITVTNTDTGSAQNIFKNIAVSGQSDIVADTNNDTLTFAAGAGISLTTNATTDTLTITNTAATNIACFAAYSTQNLSLTTSGVEYPIEFNVESITNASFFTHSTTVDPEEITVLVAGKYEISMGYVAANGNSSIATVQGYIGINGVGVLSFSFLQLNTSTVGQYVSTGFNTYIYDLSVNDVITAIFFPAYVGGSTGTITINPSGYDGSSYITIKKIG